MRCIELLLIQLSGKWVSPNDVAGFGFNKVSAYHALRKLNRENPLKFQRKMEKGKVFYKYTPLGMIMEKFPEGERSV